MTHFSHQQLGLGHFGRQSCFPVSLRVLTKGAKSARPNWRHRAKKIFQTNCPELFEAKNVEHFLLPLRRVSQNIVAICGTILSNRVTGTTLLRSNPSQLPQRNNPRQKAACDHGALLRAILSCVAFHIMGTETKDFVGNNKFIHVSLHFCLYMSKVLYANTEPVRPL